MVKGASILIFFGLVGIIESLISVNIIGNEKDRFKCVSRSAIIVKRVEPHQEADTSEIKKLTRSAGYEISSTFTQSRQQDKEYNIGQGKLHEVQICAQEIDADVIVIDNEMGAYQMYNFGIYVPDNVEVLDRYSLILNIFEDRATTKKSQLQVEMARLRYELPRAETKASLAKREEHPGFMGLGEYDRGREKSIKNRIKSIRSELKSIQDKNSSRRSQRRSSGFDLVSIAGYTNAGKSTLLRRLAEDHRVDENNYLHQDQDPTAESTQRFFTTLDTTTRKMDFDKRDVLLTDTVGFIDDLPSWLVDAFAATFDSIYKSDLVLLAVDITNDIEVIRQRVATCHDILSDHDTIRIITVFNKTDEISNEELHMKKTELSALAPNPVCISSINGDNINKLKQRIHRSLPPFREDTLLLPLQDESMSLVSWVYDNAHVSDCEYTDTNVIIEYEGRDWVVEKAKSKAGEIVTERGGSAAD